MLKAIVCEGCGASLPVSEVAKFVTCNHCGRSFQLHSESLPQPEEIQEPTETDRLRQSLEGLERRWNTNRTYRLSNGATTEVDSVWWCRGYLIGGLVGIVIFGLAAIVWSMFFINLALYGGGGAACLGIYFAIKRAKAIEYRTAFRKYEAERTELLQQLEQLQARDASL